MPSTVDGKTANVNKFLVRILLAGVVIAGMILAFVYRESFSPEALAGWLTGLGWIAPVVFMACYALATVFFLPGFVFTLAGGVLFGPFFGTIYNLTGATIGATLAFLLARYVAHDWVSRRSGKQLSRLVEGVRNEGWRFVAFVRLVPLFPFNLLNYALGLTGIRLSHYVVATFIFMAPGGAAYTYVGYAGRELAIGGEDIIRKGLLGLALVATVIFVSRLLMKRRAAGAVDSDRD